MDYGFGFLASPLILIKIYFDGNISLLVPNRKWKKIYCKTIRNKKCFLANIKTRVYWLPSVYCLNLKIPKKKTTFFTSFLINNTDSRFI